MHINESKILQNISNDNIELTSGKMELTSGKMELTSGKMELTSGKKIKPEHQDVIDNQLDKLVVLANPYFKSMNFTPNMITTLSLIFGLIALYFLNNNNSVLAGISYFISYFFDCQDGNYARTYNMCSKYGNLYDKISDFIVIFGIIYIVLKNKYQSKFVYFTIICGIIISILCLKYYLKQDEYYYAIEKNNEHNVDMSSMKYLKYFGTGCAALYVTIAMIISGYYKK